MTVLSATLPVFRRCAGLIAATTIALTSFPVLAQPTPPVPTTGAPGQLTGDEAGMGMNTCKKWPANRKFTITIPRESELDQLVKTRRTAPRAAEPR